MNDHILHTIIDTWPVGVLSTFGKAGIDSVPIVFARAEGALFTPVDAKPKSGRQLARIRNLEDDARYTLLLQHFEDDWTRLWWLRIRGHGRPLAPGDGHPRVIEALKAKYEQYRNSDTLLSPATPLIRLEIEGSRAWAWQGETWLAEQFAKGGNEG